MKAGLRGKRCVLASKASKALALPEAQSRGDRGVVRLAFSVDRSGGVHNARVVSSSGSNVLDRETLAMIERASPLPPPPDAVRGAYIPVVVPIAYFIR